jgi:hypothetical protein
LHGTEDKGSQSLQRGHRVVTSGSSFWVGSLGDLRWSSIQPWGRVRQASITTTMDTFGDEVTDEMAHAASKVARLALNGTEPTVKY